MLTDPLFYLVAIPAVMLLGLSKGGFAGVSQLALPLLALVISPVKAAAIMLPILLVQDVVGIWAYRREFDRSVLALMIPTSVVGIALGWLFATRVSVNGVLGMLGVISILFAAWRLYLSRGGGLPPASHASPWIGGVLGVIAGFTSQIAHAGQPPFQMWVMPKRLEKGVLVGTTAIYFFTVNWLKVPAYLALGQFTRENLTAAAVLTPLAIVATLTGVWLVRRVQPEKFYLIIYLLMLGVGVHLLWRALTG